MVANNWSKNGSTALSELLKTFAYSIV